MRGRSRSRSREGRYHHSSSYRRQRSRSRSRGRSRSRSRGRDRYSRHDRRSRSRDYHNRPPTSRRQSRERITRDWDRDKTSRGNTNTNGVGFFERQVIMQIYNLNNFNVHSGENWTEKQTTRLSRIFGFDLQKLFAVHHQFAQIPHLLVIEASVIVVINLTEKKNEDDHALEVKAANPLNDVNATIRVTTAYLEHQKRINRFKALRV